jgi:hypothetical protein
VAAHASAHPGSPQGAASLTESIKRVSMDLDVLAMETSERLSELIGLSIRLILEVT